MSDPKVLFVVENALEKDFAFWLEPSGLRYLVRIGDPYEVVLDGVLSEPPGVRPTEDGEILISCMGNVRVLHRGEPATPKWGYEP